MCILCHGDTFYFLVVTLLFKTDFESQLELHLFSCQLCKCEVFCTVHVSLSHHALLNSCNIVFIFTSPEAKDTFCEGQNGLFSRWGTNLHQACSSHKSVSPFKVCFCVKQMKRTCFSVFSSWQGLALIRAFLLRQTREWHPPVWT